MVQAIVPETRACPVVGGEHHGKVFKIPASTKTWRYVETPRTAVYTGIAVLTVRKFCTILPGRTDLQMFPVLTYGSVADQLAWNAILCAWAEGWSPPDDTSELREGR